MGRSPATLNSAGHRSPSRALSNKFYVIDFYSWGFFQQRNFYPVFNDMCKYSEERRKELMGSIKLEQQIPANHQCSVFNGLLLKIEKQAK